MSVALYAHIDRVDVIAPKHMDFASTHALLQHCFDYVIEVSEYEEMDWSPTLHQWAPTLGGWFLAVSRSQRFAEGYFPNEWEQDCFDLPSRLIPSGFAFGRLNDMIVGALQAKAAFEEFGRSAIVVFRPGPHWLRSRRRSSLHYSRRSPGSAA